MKTSLGLPQKERFQAILDGLANAEVSNVVECARHKLIDAGAPRPLVILGSGTLGQLLLESARKAVIAVRAFADNNSAKWGTTIEGVPVISVAEAVSTFNDSATFLIGIFNGSKPKDQLRALSCQRIASYPEFAWTFPEATQFIPRISRPAAILAHRDEMLEAYSMLADEQSRIEFAGQVAWRITLDSRYLPPHEDIANIYFDRHVMALRGDDVVYDCGAFDGDTLRALLAGGNSFRRYYALEPDTVNRQALTVYVDSLGSDLRRVVTVLPIAVGAGDESLAFEAGRGAGSGRRVGGACRVASARIDDLAAVAPTIIKMDIEGMELEALRGASATVARHVPNLAIAAYHNSEHLWELPLLLKQLAPSYDVFLRRYAEECWETVYYAVARERTSSRAPHDRLALS